MGRGIAAFVFMTSLILAMSVLSGVSYYEELGAELDPDTANDDVVAANDALSGIDYNEDRSNSILQGPLAAVVPVVGILQTIKAVVANTSGVLQLLYGIPPAVADPIETIFRLAMGLTIVYLARGLMQ